MVTRINIFSLIALLSLLGNSNLSAMEGYYSIKEDNLVPVESTVKMEVSSDLSFDINIKEIIGYSAITTNGKIYTLDEEKTLCKYDEASLKLTKKSFENICNLMGTGNIVCFQNADLSQLYIQMEDDIRTINLEKENCLDKVIQNGSSLIFHEAERGYRSFLFDLDANKFKPLYEKGISLSDLVHATAVFGHESDYDGKRLLIAGNNGIRACSLQNDIIDTQFTFKDNASVVDLEVIGNTLFNTSDKTIRAWDLKEKKHLATMKGHTGSVEALKATNDGNLLFSGSLDKTIGVWNPKTFQQLGKILVGNYVFNLQVSSNNLLASGNWAYPKTSVFSLDNIKEQLKIKDKKKHDEYMIQ